VFLTAVNLLVFILQHKKMAKGMIKAFRIQDISASESEVHGGHCSDANGSGKT